MATPTERFYTSTQIQDKFGRLNKDQKISVLMSALDYMQQYNGRSRFLCIAMAMGYENREGLDNTYTKRYPTGP